MQGLNLKTAFEKSCLWNERKVRVWEFMERVRGLQAVGRGKFMGRASKRHTMLGPMNYVSGGSGVE